MSYKSIPAELHFILDRVENCYRVDPEGIRKALETICAEHEMRQNRAAVTASADGSMSLSLNAERHRSALANASEPSEAELNAARRRHNLPIPTL
jgi:hypothetical protein